MSASDRSLTAGRLLARNTGLNLVGAAAPLLVAFAAVPRLVEGLGADRFGLLSLVWVVIGYFGFFDLGLGWALTKLVADRLGADRAGEVPALTWTALAIMTAFGVVGGVVLAALAPWLVGHVLTVPAALQPEARIAFRCVAISIPFVIATAGLRGLLAAFQRFDLITAIRVPVGVFTYLAPLAVILVSRSLPAVVAVLVAGRVVATGAHFVFCRRVVPGFAHGFTFESAVVGPLLRFGGWMTVSNVVGPLMVSADRFVIGAMLSVASVAYYSTPYEVVSKLLLFPSVVLGVLFPALAMTLRTDAARAGRLYARGTAVVFTILLPLLLALATFAPEGLGRWLGPEFALRSTFVLRALAVGVFVNGVAQVAFGLIQGAGRPDFTARLHLGELVIYAPLLAWLVRRWGIEGAAVAWAARAAIDAGALLVFAGGRAPGMKARAGRVAIATGIAVAAFAFCIAGDGVAVRGGRLVIALLVLAGTVAFVLLPREDRARLRRGPGAKRAGRASSSAHGEPRAHDGRTVVLLAAANVVHTVRWANALAARGHRIHLATAHPPADGIDSRVIVHRLPHAALFGYVTNRGALRRLVSEIRPDLVHTFFATGYGTLARLAAVHPHVLTVLGSDVLLFPKRSSLHRALVAANLAATDVVCSTGRLLAERTRELAPGGAAIEIVPFGVDTGVFRPSERERDPARITVGTVKALAPRYGMDVLVKAFARARERLRSEDPECAERMHLLVVGGGPDGERLRALAARLGIAQRCEIPGPVPHEQVPQVLHRLDVYVAPSRSESFGVAVLEASACGLPVVVSDAGGLPEVVRDGVTGRIVPVEDVEATADAILELVRSAELRRAWGEAGRAYVQERFEWSECVPLQEAAYDRCLAVAGS